MDEEVAQTLAALERKLGELERELSQVNREALGEQDQGSAPELTVAPAGVLIDEAAERRYSMEARETVFGEIPATKDERQSIDLADLVRFKTKMQVTLQGLIDEYSELLSLKPPTDA